VCLMKKQIIPMFALTEDQINSRQDSLVVESFIRIFLLQCISFIYIFIHCKIFGVILWYSDLELRASGLWFGVESHWFLIWTWEPLVPELDLRASGFWLIITYLQFVICLCSNIIWHFVYENKSLHSFNKFSL
jgi:hypothetical protein